MLGVRGHAQSRLCRQKKTTPHFNVKLVIIYYVKKSAFKVYQLGPFKKKKTTKKEKGLVIVFSQSLFTMVNVTLAKDADFQNTFMYIRTAS